MDITNLILMCGEVKIQPLDSCFTKFDAATSRNPTRLQFGTEADVYPNLTPHGIQLRGADQGIVVWLPREKVAAAIAGDKGPKNPDANRKFEAALSLLLTLQAAEQAGALDCCEVAEAGALLDLLKARIGSHEPL